MAIKSCILLFILATSDGFGQIPNDTTNVSFYSLYQESIKIKFPVGLILGKWTSCDSLESQIEFKSNGSFVEIFPQNFINPYSFRIENDSIPMAGCAMNWPPYYCILKSITNGILEIDFYYGLGMEYVRKTTFNKIN